jgi:hypothetical protein
LCFWSTQLDRKKKVSVEGEEGNKKNEEKRRAKRPSSSSFSAAKSDNNGIITSRARNAQTREEVVVERERFRSRTGTPRRFFSRKKSRFFPVGGALALFPTRFFFSK